MQTQGDQSLAVTLVVLAAICVVLAVLYAFGVIGWFSIDPGARAHYKHAILLMAVAVAALIAANFVRPKAIQR
jgi:hypothetical protein